MIINGDSLDVLKTLEPESIDAIITDPPYGFAFMGKKWDYDVPSVELWVECLRVLKPGGHLLAFAGTRTQHRMAVRIEDAGFEIRDMIAWVYGSGFPKSLDVARAIDGADRIGFSRERSLKFTEFMRSTGLTPKQINELTASNMASHYLTDKEQPAVATEDMFSKLRPAIYANGVTIPDEIEELVRWRTTESENLKRREVVGTKVGVDTKKQKIAAAVSAQNFDKSTRHEYQITTAHTENAKAWEGWGTALKPALEPITVARKPFKGSVAENVMRYGTGALNIDKCRIGTEVLPEQKAGAAKIGTFERENMTTPERIGRWPANLIHDGSQEVNELFPESEGEGKTSRFFYCPKENAQDRYLGIDTANGNRDKIINNHPTVKPVELMEYLIRLTTPKNAKILDPFAGSGTTGVACVNLHRQYVLIERQPEYIKIIEKRIANAIRLRGYGDLFNPIEPTTHAHT